MSGYAITQIEITNPEDYKQYLAKVTDIVTKFGGEFLVRGGEFQCFEGERGKRGRLGENGESGNLGKVRLIKSDGPLKPERKSLLVNHQNFGQDLRLSQNIWDQRSGILNLIHPNSIVSNDYYIFEKRLEKTIAFYWEENRFVNLTILTMN